MTKPLISCSLRNIVINNLIYADDSVVFFLLPMDCELYLILGDACGYDNHGKYNASKCGVMQLDFRQAKLARETTLRGKKLTFVTYGKRFGHVI